MTDSLSDLLALVEPKPASYLRTAHTIETSTGDSLQSARISFLSSFTAEILDPYLVVEGARRGLRIRSHYCPFNQIELQAFDSSSELYATDPDIIAVALRLEESAPNLLWRFVALTGDGLEAELAEVHARLHDLLGQIRKRSNAVVLLFNYPRPSVLDAGFADSSMEVSQGEAIARVNATVASVCRDFPGAYVFDFAQLVAEHGLVNMYDANSFWGTRTPFGFHGHVSIAQRLARYVRATLRPPCKCLVVDLDNTLWGGVIGEDGIQGIELGEDYPGNVYKHFQRRLLSLRDQGILLAVASKNNKADAVEALEEHPDMILRPADFAATQIHWNDKISSLSAIADDLNIGLDSLAFFDDSPVERAMVQGGLPQVTVIDVPPDPIGYTAALEQSGAFDRLLISTDDRRRADMVRESAEREQSLGRATSIDDFLQDLEMVATVGHSDSATLPRIEQLLAKTNQFNLTTRRHTAATLEALVDGQNAIILWMRLRDRFGDNGLTGVAIGVPESHGHWRVDSLLLSCRVIGRQAERVLVSALAQRVAGRGGETLIGEYEATAKNGQVAELYPSLGFRPLGAGDSSWALDLATAGIDVPSFIRVEWEGEAADAPS